MIREQTLRARQKLVSKLPVSGELLRGSLLERTVRHTKDCPKCARARPDRTACAISAPVAQDGVLALTQLGDGHFSAWFIISIARLRSGAGVA